MKVSNTFGKFGGLLIRHSDDTRRNSTDKNISAIDESPLADRGMTAPSGSSSTHPRLAGPFSHSGQLFGKIRFKRVQADRWIS